MRRLRLDRGAQCLSKVDTTVGCKAAMWVGCLGDAAGTTCAEIKLCHVLVLEVLLSTAACKAKQHAAAVARYSVAMSGCTGFLDLYASVS
jgi:hypothetical protein